MLIGKQQGKELVQIILEPYILKHLGNYLAFPNVSICLLLTNVQALCCSHLFRSCLLKFPENVTRFNLVSSCWKFPKSISRHERTHSLSLELWIFWWYSDANNSLFILFCCVSQVDFFLPIKIRLSTKNWMAVKILILQSELQ